MVWDKPQDDGLTEYHLKILGGPKQITIPLRSRLHLREVADALRGLCNTIDMQCRRGEISEYEALSYVMIAINETNAKIRFSAEAHGVKFRRGRAPASESAEQEGNEPATAKVARLVKPQYPVESGER